LHLIAPILTFGFILSFFKTIFAYLNYGIHFFAETYIFTQLNKNSLELAKSLKKNCKRRMIVFADISEQVEEEQAELLEEARKIGAVCLKKNISLYNFSFHYIKSRIVFLALNEDENESIEQALSVMEKYGNRKNTELYVFASSVESELIFSSMKESHIKVRRVKEEQVFVNHLLYEEGIKIFESAVAYDENTKLISAIVIGLGEYGSQIAKALPWFCQMDGYRTEIHLFDSDEMAADRYACSCPELLDEKHNGDFETDGEAHYQITIHRGIDIDSCEFREILDRISKVSYVFVALGEDKKNIRIASELRTYFEKRSLRPIIDAVVFDPNKVNALQGLRNYSGQDYQIHFVADREEVFSEKTIMYSELEAVALERHLKWGTEDEFWRFEYNYRSSVASAIHRKMKILCGIPGIEKKKEERTEEEVWSLRKLEHSRWNAYMRTQGFTWAEKRNNLAKTHHCLVPFDKLSLKDQEKDDD